MSNNVKYPLVLAMVCIGAALALAGSYWITKDRIDEKERQARDAALDRVLPGSVVEKREVKPADEDGAAIFAGVDANGDTVAYATLAVGRGYANVIKVMVGVRPDYSLSGISIVSQQETPGLGARVEEVKTDKTLWTVLLGGEQETEAVAERPWFQEQFKGVTLDRLEVVKVEPEKTDKIAAITGATITSNAVTDVVKDAVAYVRDHLESGAGD